MIVAASNKVWSMRNFNRFGQISGEELEFCILGKEEVIRSENNKRVEQTPTPAQRPA
jgi:hypothetical protein